MKLKRIILCALLSIILTPIVAKTPIFNSKINSSIKKYTNIKNEDVKYAKAGINFFNEGDFANSVICFEYALKLAIIDHAPKVYIDNLKIKLGTAYVNNGKVDKGRKLFQEVHGVKLAPIKK